MQLILRHTIIATPLLKCLLNCWKSIKDLIKRIAKDETPSVKNLIKSVEHCYYRQRKHWKIQIVYAKNECVAYRVAGAE